MLLPLSSNDSTFALDIESGFLPFVCQSRSSIIIFDDDDDVFSSREAKLLLGYERYFRADSYLACTERKERETTRFDKEEPMAFVALKCYGGIIKLCVLFPISFLNILLALLR